MTVQTRPPAGAYAGIMATFKVARTISRDDVASFLRGATQILAPRFGRVLTWS